MAGARAAGAGGAALAADDGGPDHLNRLADPKLALEPLEGLIVIDEIQREPELFPLLRVLVDRRPRRQRYLILGSASRELIRQSAETLAGRIAYLELPPFTAFEAPDPARLWLRGGFPPAYLAPSDADSLVWRKAYVTTFLERDVPALGIDLAANTLRRFWMMLAHWHGNVFNASAMARGEQPSSVRASRSAPARRDTRRRCWRRRNAAPCRAVSPRQSAAWTSLPARRTSSPPSRPSRPHSKPPGFQMATPGTTLSGVVPSAFGGHGVGPRVDQHPHAATSVTLAARKNGVPPSRFSRFRRPLFMPLAVMRASTSPPARSSSSERQCCRRRRWNGAGEPEAGVHAPCAGEVRVGAAVEHVVGERPGCVGHRHHPGALPVGQGVVDVGGPPRAAPAGRRGARPGTNVGAVKPVGCGVEEPLAARPSRSGRTSPPTRPARAAPPPRCCGPPPTSGRSGPGSHRRRWGRPPAPGAPAGGRVAGPRRGHQRHLAPPQGSRSRSSRRRHQATPP